jgi:hypothetical protein
MHASVEVKRVDLWTLFRLAFLLYAAMGLIAGLFYAGIMTLIGGLGGALAEEDIPGLGLLTGVVGIFLVPVLAFVYGAVGSVMVTIAGALFNLMCRVAGGLKFDVAFAQPLFGASTPTPSTTPAPRYIPPAVPPPPQTRPTPPEVPPPPPPPDPPRFE